jgi:1-acyl-sn-glycerol-3-phosphate acyltransferase
LNLAQIASAAFLVLLAAALLVAIVIALLRSPLTPIQSLLWAIAFLLCKFRWRTQWAGPLLVPDGQGAVIVLNHRSSVDPFFVQTATGRKIHWLVAREYCEHPAFRWFLSTCEVIPVRRGGIDTAATKAAIRLTSEGGLVGMLPEGRINMTDEFMLPARPGAALIALKARVPVVPCYIEGSPYRRHPWSPLLMTARVRVQFGQPLDLSEFYGREGEPGVVAEAMDRILRAMAQLAGRSDFEPKIAGRNWKPTEEELEAAMSAVEARDQESGRRNGP